MNTFTKRSVVLASLLLVGLPFSSSVEHSALAFSTEAPIETTLSQAVAIGLSEEGIEDRQQGTGALSREYQFTGSANEIVVVYWDVDSGSYYSGVPTLYDTAGVPVEVNYNYPAEMFWEESDGQHAYFLLPVTGNYRLVFAAESSSTEDDFNYLLRARVASYYERLMIAADELSNDGQFEASLPLLALAIEQEPDLPAPYLQRLVGYATTLFESEAWEAGITRISDIDPAENPEIFYEVVYETFKTLDEDAQAMVIGDLKQVGRTYALAVENGQTEVDEISPAVFAGLAEFLETGEPTDAIRQLLFGEQFSEPVEEPVTLPPVPVAPPTSPLPVEPVAPLQ